MNETLAWKYTKKMVSVIQTTHYFHTWYVPLGVSWDPEGLCDSGAATSTLAPGVGPFLWPSPGLLFIGSIRLHKDSRMMPSCLHPIEGVPVPFTGAWTHLSYLTRNSV